jgi:hypothetical protein
MASGETDPLVIALAGYTKSGKTRVGHILSMYIGFPMVELSGGIWNTISLPAGPTAIADVAKAINELREKYGADVLARLAIEITRGESLIVRPGWSHEYRAPSPSAVSATIRTRDLAAGREDALADKVFTYPARLWVDRD